MLTLCCSVFRPPVQPFAMMSPIRRSVVMLLVLLAACACVSVTALHSSLAPLHAFDGQAAPTLAMAELLSVADGAFAPATVALRTFAACNLGDSQCTRYQAFGFCCPPGSSLAAEREGPKRYVGKCSGHPGNKGTCAKKPKANYKPPRFPACKKGNASCRDNKYGEKVESGDRCCPGGSDLEATDYDVDKDEFVGPVTCIGRRFQCADDDEDE